MDKKTTSPAPTRAQLMKVVDAIFPGRVPVSDYVRERFLRGESGVLRREDVSVVNLVHSVWHSVRSGEGRSRVHTLHEIYSSGAGVARGDVVRIFQKVEDEVADAITAGSLRATMETATAVTALPGQVICPFCSAKLPLSALDAEFIFPCGCGFGMLMPKVEDFVLDPVGKRDYVWRAASEGTEVYHPRRADAVSLWRAVEKTKVRTRMRAGMPSRHAEPTLPTAQTASPKPLWAGSADQYTNFWLLTDPICKSKAGWTPLVWAVDPEIILWHEEQPYIGPGNLGSMGVAPRTWAAAHIKTIKRWGSVVNLSGIATSAIKVFYGDPETAAKRFQHAGKPT